MKHSIVRTLVVGLLCMAIIGSAIQIVKIVKAEECDDCEDDGGSSDGGSDYGGGYDDGSLASGSPDGSSPDGGSPAGGSLDTGASDGGSYDSGGSSGSYNSGSSNGGELITDTAKTLIAEYKQKGITYCRRDDPESDQTTADCSGFVWDVLNQAGVDEPPLNQFSTKTLPNSPYFVEVTTPQPGDVILENGHMGIIVGFNNAGDPLVAQMGNHGPAIISWNSRSGFGGDPAYYRPQPKFRNPGPLHRPNTNVDV